MNLSVCSTTLREIAGDSSQFPDKLRSLICDAVSDISLADMETMRGKHESNSENFDGRIEQNILAANQEMTLTANCRISDLTKFDNDLIIEENGNLVCLEIEKGHKARFEFDILKMQAFASHRKREKPKTKIYGAFLVPTENIVDRNISGNSREPSYKYLCRLLTLVAQINPFLLEDILIVGYGISKTDTRVIKRGRNKKNTHLKAGQNNLEEGNGLRPDEMLRDVLMGYPQNLVCDLRKRLEAKFPKLREKINRKSRYLGYSNGDTDAMYVYVQKKRLLIDINIPPSQADNLRRKVLK